MEEYTFQGESYTREELEQIALEKGYSFEQLLQKNPSIELAGKQTGVPSQAANVTPENVAADGDSNLANTSLESQRLTRKELEEQEEKRQAGINAGFQAINVATGGKAPGGLIKKTAAFAGGFGDILKGIGEFVDMQYDAGVVSPINPLGPIPKLIKGYITGEEDPDMINTKGLTDISIKLKSLNKKYYNDDGSQADFVDLVEQGRMGEASDELVSNVFTAAPSLAIAFIPGIGIPALSASAAGNAYERTMMENPDANKALAYAVSTTQGAVEGLSELAGVRFIKNGKRALKFLRPKVGDKVAEKLVKESLETTSNKFVKAAFNLPIKGAGEAFTEGFANVVNESLQEAVFNEGFQEGEFGMILRKSLNEAATGFVLGGGASIATSQVTDPAVQNIAFQIAPNSTKLDILTLEKQKFSLIDIKSKTKRKKDQVKIQNQIEGIEKQISAEKADLVTAFNNMSKKEKLDYAKSIDNIDAKYDFLYNTNYKKSEKDIKQIEEDIKAEYKNLETAAYKKYGVTKKTEELITRVIKGSEKITSQIRNNKFKDLDVQVLRTAEEISQAQEKTPGFKTSDGIFVSKGTDDTKAKILINLPVASAAGQTNVLGHEKLHYLLAKYFKTDNASLTPLVNSFKTYLQESNNGNILSRIEARIKKNYTNKDKTLKKGALEEYFNIFSDIVANEEVNVVEEKGIANKMAKAYTNTMQGLGFAEVKLTNGKEVFDFIRNYTKNIQKSDKILNVKLIGYGQIQKITESDVVIKKSKSKEIDDAYEAGASPFDLTQLYEPLVNKLINKYKNVPDFSVLKEDLIQNALYEKGGVIDLVNSYDGRGTLSGYVGKLLPLRMNKMASDLFGQKFTDDVTERVDVAAAETLPEQVEREETQQQELAVAKTQEKRNILDRANLSSELQLKALNASKKILGTMLPQIDIKKGKNFREKYKIAVRNMLFDDVSNELRAYSSPDYNGYIKLNAEALYDIMPLADLTKSQALKNLFLDQQFDKDGKPIRVLESFTGKKSYAGNLVFKKKPFKQIEEAFLNEFAKKHSNSVQRKAFIINTLAKEIAFDESMEALNDPIVQEKIPLTQETAVKEFMEEFEMNIQRGRFTKYSKSEALDNWFESDKTFKALANVVDNLSQVVKLMQPTGQYRHLEDPLFGDAFVEYFDVPAKYANDIRNDLNNLFFEKIAQTTGTLKLSGSKIIERQTVGVRPLVLGVFRTSLGQDQDKAYDYVMKQITGDTNAAKDWSKDANKKFISNEYHESLKTFASEYLTEDDIKTEALRENVYKNLVDTSVTNGFAEKIDEFFGYEKIEPKNYNRKRAGLSTFAGPKNIKSFKIKETIEKVNNGDLSDIDAHNKYVAETVRPQFERILLSLYEYVENGKGSPNENSRKKFAVRFATMMFRGGNTYTPFRESAFITHIAKNIKNPYAEHAKPILKLGTDFMVSQDGNNFLAALTTGGAKGKKILKQAITSMYKSNGVFIIDSAQGAQIDQAYGKTDIPNTDYITSRFQGVIPESEIISIESGLALTDGNTYDLNKGLNSEVAVARLYDKNNEKMVIKLSKSAPAEFAEMLDRKSKNAAVVRSDKDFALAANLGKKANYKNKWNIFLPYSAEDFYGLLQKTAGTGKQGDEDLKFIKAKFLDPYDRGIANLEIDRRALLKEYRKLKKQIKGSPEKLNKKLTSIGLDAFTVEDAVRMFIWKQQGMAVPNISKTNANKLSSYVEKNSDLRKFAFGLIKANKSDKYPEPDNNWFAGNIGVDLSNSINKNKRSKYLETWNKNINLILNDKNKTKLTAAFGTDYVKNLESIIARMKSGTNRRVTDSKIVNSTLDFINGSVGTIMFFNMRSASLQLISAANYINWSDNNPLQAGKALANVPQYTKDLIRLLNSDFLVNRRNGLKINIQEAELADAVKSDNKFKAIMATILKAGFIPTQIADSLAIAGGGATFYRNRLNTYLKEGLSEKNAESKAYNDWRQIANDSQQSSDASRISNIQASDFGRLVFAFANTPFQYTRLTKKAASDLINGRGDVKSNASKIVYYMFVQNLIFNFLQNALFAAEAEEDETKLQAMLKSDKIPRVVNNMSDSVLRGVGFTGAVLSMIKNTGLAYYKEKQKDEWRQDSSNVLLAITDISPPIDHKARKIKALVELGKYENDIPDSIEAAINIASILNVPLDRVQRKLENMQGATDRDLDNWVRAFQLMGWSEWELEDSKNKKAQRTILKTK
jgi:hypothetical protein